MAGLVMTSRIPFTKFFFFVVYSPSTSWILPSSALAGMHFLVIPLTGPPFLFLIPPPSTSGGGGNRSKGGGGNRSKMGSLATMKKLRDLGASTDQGRSGKSVQNGVAGHDEKAARLGGFPRPREVGEIGPK